MIIKQLPQHVRYADNSAITEIPEFNAQAAFSYGTEIPHRLNVLPNNKMSAILKHTDELKEGDEIQDEYGWKAVVSEILERRPARGDWSNNPFDIKPDFILFTYV